MERIVPNELEKRVDEVLFYIWDPIGINDDLRARAEYRGYVTGILGRLQADKPAGEIASYLCSIETEDMGLPGNERHAMNVAKLLIRHKEAIALGLS